MGHLEIVLPEFERYAVYFAPEPGSELAEFGRAWFGSAESQWAPLIKTPQRYGFHATLKAPMRLAEGNDYDDLRKKVEELCAAHSPVPLGTLKLKRLTNFLALVVDPEQHEGVADLGWACVSELDHLRAPLTNEERRKRGDLSGQKKSNLEEWGYPYVGKEFRFHMTLTSSLDEEELNNAQSMLEPMLPTEPVTIRSICIFGDPGGTRQFELVERFDLKGAKQRQ